METIRNSLGKVMKLRGVTFESIYESKEQIKLPTKEYFQKTDASEEDYKLTSAVAAQMNNELGRKRIGVVAQEVEAVVPEVVRTTYDGKKAVSYSELVGLLIEAIKEQQMQIENLQMQMDVINPDSFAKKIQSSQVAEISNVLSECKLHQNSPNPFTEQTEISYELSAATKQAYICIFDMQGQMLNKLDALGKNHLIIQGSQLTPGMYLYSLIADGQEIDTKRMILTK